MEDDLLVKSGEKVKGEINMNPLMQDALGSILRKLLMAACAVLITNGYWTEERATTYVAAAASGLLSIGWGLWKAYGSRLKIVTALATPGLQTEDHLEKQISIGLSAPASSPKSEIPTKKIVPGSVKQ